MKRPVEPTMPVGKYCESLTQWLRIISQKEHPLVEARVANSILFNIKKSCLLKRMIYMGEDLRTVKCPIHNGEWSGCYAERCPAGCDTCGCACGWIPNETKVLVGLGWTFWLAHAVDPNHKMPGIFPSKYYANSYGEGQ